MPHRAMQFLREYSQGVNLWWLNKPEEDRRSIRVERCGEIPVISLAILRDWAIELPILQQEWCGQTED